MEVYIKRQKMDYSPLIINSKKVAKIAILILFIVCDIFVISCTRVIDRKNCEKIEKIEVFSSGFPNINFPIKQSELDVRKNLQGEILDNERLETIKQLIFKLRECKEEKNYLGSIIGVCDIYCENGGKYTLIYDRFSIVIGGEFFCIDDDLISELFRRKPDKSS